ncbi:MAG: hypothetical protein GY772_08180 [bacterium]|nr:hypothetical protein [bacterium]
MAEAIRMQSRAFLSTAKTMSLVTDERRGRLLLRFSASNDRLEVRRGVLGLERDFGKGNKAIKRAIVVAFTRFATCGVCHPMRSGASFTAPRDAVVLATDDSLSALSVRDTGGEGELQPELLKTLQEITEFFGADGADDEQLSARLLIDEAFLPNLKVKHLDHAHGGRRLTSRPWRADELTQEVSAHLIFGKHSITSLIQNSPEVQQWLAAHVKRCQGRAHVLVSALASGLKRHRFDSTQIPLARHVLRTQAVIKTALQIAATRRNTKEALAANFFLLYISGRDGLLRHLLLSMLADAGDESIIVVRSVDTERANPAELAFDIARFVHNIQYLFLEGNCTKHGYTKVMLEFLRTPMIYTVNGTALQSGSPSGVPQDVIDECVAHTQCWARLAIATARAEFPEFSALNAMSVFKVQRNDEDGPHSVDTSVVMAGDANVEEKLEIIADVFGQDRAAVLAEHLDIRLITRSLLRSGEPITDSAAWRRAILRCEMKHNTRQHPTSALKPIVMRWLGWCISTSGLE